MSTPPRVPKGHRPQVFDDPAVDQLYAAYVAMATELAVAFDRIAALEKALERTGGIGPEELERIALEQSQTPEQASRRVELAERLLRPFKAFRDAHLEAGGGKAVDRDID